MKKYKVLFNILVTISIILSSACSQPPTTNQSTAAPSSTPKPRITAKPSSTPSPLPSPTVSPTATALPTATAQPSDFIRAKGNKIVKGADEQVIYLRGINFSNYNWAPGEEIRTSKHHSKIDFRRVADMGMNVIRFDLSYRIFEDDDQPYTYLNAGWGWLNEQIDWAKEANLYLILNIHVAQGYDGAAGDKKLWEDPESQERLAALWTAIAARYKNEPAIAGYDLLNEPSTSVEEWQKLADRLVKSIRAVDTNHLLIVEGVPWGNSINVLVDDPNVMYDFHFYQPYEYSHGPGYGRDGGTYPDEKKVEVVDGNDMQGTENFHNPLLKSGTTDWTFYTGVRHRVVNPRTQIGIPAMLCRGSQGKAYFSDFSVQEWDENGKDLGTIVSVDFNQQIFDGPWSEDGKTIFANIADCTADTCGSRGAVMMQAAQSASTISDWRYIFDAVPGHSYTLSGWMKGQDINPGADCSMNIEWNGTKSGKPFFHRTKAYLEHQIREAAKVAIEKNVPINLGEIGLFHTDFTPEAGGINWLNDVIDILVENGFSFQYWAYHDNFGIYPDINYAVDEQKPVPGLIEFFTEKFHSFPK